MARPVQQHGQRRERRMDDVLKGHEHEQSINQSINRSIVLGQTVQSKQVRRYQEEEEEGRAFCRIRKGIAN